MLQRLAKWDEYREYWDIDSCRQTYTWIMHSNYFIFEKFKETWKI